MDTPVKKDNAQWKQELDPDTYHVMRQCGTEAPFSGKYWDHHEEGKYLCAACGLELFASEAKFDSGSGWPSFDRPIDPKAVAEREDDSHGMTRTEILCPRCGGHLGHVFNDGPRGTTGMRYCVNSLSLKFQPKEKK